MRDASFLGVFVSVNVVTVMIVAAFSSATFGGERLHDRYLFYVVPLWLVLFALWLVRGASYSWRSLAVGTALCVALLATMPQRLLLRDTTAVRRCGDSCVVAYSRGRRFSAERSAPAARACGVGAPVRSSWPENGRSRSCHRRRVRPQRRVRLAVPHPRCGHPCLRGQPSSDLVVGGSAVPGN